jgi:hypothetical protein
VAALVRYLPAGISALLFLILFMNQLHSPVLWLLFFMPAMLGNVLMNEPRVATAGETTGSAS